MYSNRQNADFKILIVDDVPKNIQVLGNILLKENYQISYTQNGIDALAMIKDNKFDLILLDVMMPGMDGFEVCAQLKQDAESREIPIIFLTAKVEKESVVKGFNLGAQDYVTKPFNAEELLARVRTHLELKDKNEQLKSINQLLEQKVEERTYELKQANQRLSTLEKAKSDFLSIISHELRTPLNGISGLTSLLEESDKTPEQAEYIQYLREASNRLVRFSETALLITSLTAEQYKMDHEPERIVDLLDMAIEKNANLIETREVAIEKDIQSHDLSISVDNDMIITSFSNILDNAVKYTPEKGKVIIKAYQENGHKCVEFIDQGPGFSETALKRLYDYFSSDDVMHSEGLGLALASVKLIVDAHQGEIQIQNLPENGAIVKIVFTL